MTELVQAVDEFLQWLGSNSEWEKENRNAKPVTRKDVKAIREALNKYKEVNNEQTRTLARN